MILKSNCFVFQHFGTWTNCSNLVLACMGPERIATELKRRQPRFIDIVSVVAWRGGSTLKPSCSKFQVDNSPDKSLWDVDFDKTD